MRWDNFLMRNPNLRSKGDDEMGKRKKRWGKGTLPLGTANLISVVIRLFILPKWFN